MPPLEPHPFDDFMICLDHCPLFADPDPLGPFFNLKLDALEKVKDLVNNLRTLDLKSLLPLPEVESTIDILLRDPSMDYS